MSKAAAKGAERYRHWIVAAAIACLASAGVGFGAMDRLAGLSVDLLFWLRARTGPAVAARDPPTAVVAIDEETYRTPPFTDLPQALWTPEIARVLDALIAADARVVGFDVIFPTSIERLVAGFDRDMLIALHKGAMEGKVVLGKVQHQEYPIHPFAAQIFAVGNERNIRSLNLFTDDDGVIRRVPLMFEREGAAAGAVHEPSMALELAARAAGVAPAGLADGSLMLAGYAIPGSAQNAMMVNFAGGDAIPTYSLADLRACAAAGNAAFFRRHFAGKVVLIGAVLDVEDRKLTSMRFITTPEHPSAGERCVHPPMTGLFRADIVRDTIPGVYVLATAVDNLLRGDALSELPAWGAGAAVLALGLVAAAISMALAPPSAGLALSIAAALWAVLAALAFRYDVVLPLLAPPVAAGLTFAALLGYRFAVADRDKRLLRSSFAFYLAPTLIDRMVASDRPPQLGGELRTVTVLFSDVADFTRLSEALEPTALVSLMNTYLTAMTDIIEAEGGFVDKYVGDAIVAVFGAPLDAPDHARGAVRAALAGRARLEHLNRESAAFCGHRLRNRVGLATGEALVGNIGSRRRFNYTVMGDIVNLAARLEGANKIYGTTILAAASTRAAASDVAIWREIDRVRVLGRTQAETIFEPLAPAGAPSAAAAGLVDRFGAALDDYRARRFDVAAPAFDDLAAHDGPARVFAARARHFLSAPPPSTWDGVTDLETK